MQDEDGTWKRNQQDELYVARELPSEERAESEKRASNGAYVAR